MESLREYCYTIDVLEGEKNKSEALRTTLEERPGLPVMVSRRGLRPAALCGPQAGLQGPDRHPGPERGTKRRGRHAASVISI